MYGDGDGGSCSLDGTDDEDDDDNDDVQHDVKNDPIFDSPQQRNHRGGGKGTTTGPPHRGGGRGGVGLPWGDSWGGGGGGRLASYIHTST